MTALGRTTAIALGTLLGLVVITGILPGASHGGVFLGVTPVVHADGSIPQPGELPACVFARVVDGRGWGSLDTVKAEVSLTGCNDSAGELRLASGPHCSATSIFGRGVATCDAVPSGRELQVTFSFSFPWGLNAIASQPNPLIFKLSPGGSYSST